MNSTSVTGLNSCSANHLFYLTAYEDELCSIDDAARWTTGPFILPSRQSKPNTIIVLDSNIFSYGSGLSPIYPVLKKLIDNS